MRPAREGQSGDGEGTASGFEFEVVWSATDRLQLNLGLGLIDTNYIQSGFFDGTTGQFPGAPFAYAADQSGTLGAQYVGFCPLPPCVSKMGSKVCNAFQMGVR